MKLIILTLVLVILSFAQDDDDDSPQIKRKTYDDPDKYKNLVDWLKDGKAEFPKVEIEVRSEGYRALRAKQNIQRGEWVIFVPRTHFLTLQEVKKSCLINRKMIQVNHNPMSHQTYFVNHLLQEQRRKNSVWKPYIDVLPKDVSGFPTYFGEEELALLQGSPTLQTVLDQRWQFRQEFDNLVNAVPEFTRYKYTFDDFLKLRILTNSRSFTVNLNGEYVPVLVPLADFVNHDPEGFLGFDYSPQHDGFFMQAQRDIRRGEELFYNYGKMSNKFFFMNHGFSLDSIGMNQYDFSMCRDMDQPINQLKSKLNGNQCFFCRLVNETDHGTFRESLGVARFMAVERLDEFFELERKVQGYQGYNPGWHTFPVSTKLEKKMWIWFKDFLGKRLAEFVSTIEEDYANLRKPDLPDYRKQIIIVTLKEKQIIRENMEIADLALELIDKSSEELNKFLRYQKYHKINGYIRQLLIPMKIEWGE